MISNKYLADTGMTRLETEKHIESFNNGGSILMTYDSYQKFYQNKDLLGHKEDNSNYILNSDDMDKILTESKGDIRYIEKALGFTDGYLGKGPLYRVDIKEPQNHNIRMANGYEAGANPLFNTPKHGDKLPEYTQDWSRIRCSPKNKRKEMPTLTVDSKDKSWLKGEYYDSVTGYHAPDLFGYRGRTSGGYREAVIDLTANVPENVQYIKYDNFTKGKSPRKEIITNAFVDEKDYQNKLATFKADYKKDKNIDLSPDAEKAYRNIYVRTGKMPSYSEISTLATNKKYEAVKSDVAFIQSGQEKRREGLQVKKNRAMVKSSLNTKSTKTVTKTKGKSMSI